MRRKTKDNQPTVLDLFAGAGGFSLGFHWAGFSTTVAIDHDALAVETLDANFGQFGLRAALLDLATLTPTQLHTFLVDEQLPHEFDVVVGGPPCQGWSQVGRGKIRSLRKASGRPADAVDDPRNGLYKHFFGYVSEFKPKVAVMENVPGMQSHDGRDATKDVKELFEASGYRVAFSLMNAAEHGVPQVRERLFFVGVRADLDATFAFPQPSTKEHPVTAWDAIGDLPAISSGSQVWRRPYSPARTPSAYAQEMRVLADPGSVFDHVCRTHNDQDLEAFALMKQGGLYRDLPSRLKRYRDDIFEDKYRRLYQRRPSWCVTAHLSKDCYSHIHPTQARTISVREAARLQSFPDCFYFAGNMGSKFHLIGNAVPPILARSIADAIKRQVFTQHAPSMCAEDGTTPISARSQPSI